MARSKARTEAVSSSLNWRTMFPRLTISCCRELKTRTTFTSPSRTFSERASSVYHYSKPATNPLTRTRKAQPRNRTARAGVRPGFLRNHFRDAGFRRDEHGRRLRWVSESLSPLEIRHGIRASEQELRLWPAQNLRNGHQQRPVLCVSPGGQSSRRSKDRHGACLWALRFLQEQHLVLEDESQNDGHNGESRHEGPQVHRQVWP